MSELHLNLYLKFVAECALHRSCLQTSAMPMAGTNDPFVVSISRDAKTLEIYDYEKDDITW